MKAISEYFRDLAERDRFFGAEPPQPDAEYLHRIAEQTIKSRVNAEVTDNSLILRQDHQQEAAAPIAPAVADVPAQPVAQAPAPVAAPETAVPAFVETPDLDRAGFGEGDTIAEKLQRIRAVVSRETAEPAEVTSFYSEDEHAEDLAAPATEPQAVNDIEEPAEVETPAPVAQDVYDDDGGEAVEADVLSSIMASVSDDDTAEADVDAAADEVEADASDEDVVAEAEEAVPEAETLVVDDVTEADVEEAPKPEQAASEMAAEADDDAAEDTAVADVETEATSDTDEAEVEADASGDDTEAAADMAEVMAPIAKPRRRIIVQKISRAEVEAASTGAEIEDTAEDASAELDAEAEAALMAELAEVEADMDEDADGVADAQADPIDTEAEMEARALAAAQAAQDKADAEAAERAQAEAEATAAAAAEAQAEAEAKAAEEADALAKVMAEAAEVEADQSDDVVATESEAEAEAEEADAEATSEADTTAEDENRAARLARRALMVEDEDAALNRLMDATSTRLSDDDEGAVRRASIAHLKAAVAATKADDSIAQAAADEEERELDQYRDDLARVVRPGRARPRAEGAATSRPAPLVLVSEQRIDAPAPQADAAAAADVRPRRITAGNLALKEEMEEEVDENLFEDANVESFSNYAARYDALELPDLLEAAAAHYAFIEGAEEFTRPMLMRKIASLTTGEAPSREAGLRSFGALLREGRVVKSGNGKFVLSGKSRFTPEAREAGE